MLKRGWLTSINLQKWFLATWQEVWHLTFLEKLKLVIAYIWSVDYFISFFFMQQCVFIQHCSWDLRGWYSHETIYFLHVMLQMRLFSSINIPDGLRQKGKQLTHKQNKTMVLLTIIGNTLYILVYWNCRCIFVIIWRARSFLWFTTVIVVSKELLLYFLLSTYLNFKWSLNVMLVFYFDWMEL